MKVFGDVDNFSGLLGCIGKYVSEVETSLFFDVDSSDWGSSSKFKSGLGITCCTFSVIAL